MTEQAALTDGRTVALALERPLLRGWLHAGAAVAAMAGTACLLLLASSPAGYVGASIFGASLIALYWTSATYHRIAWRRPTWRSVNKRVDHAMIFLLIGGTYTPFCLAMSFAWGIPMLAIVWTFAALGALLKVLWPNTPRWLGVTLYVALGWTALIGVTEIVNVFTAAPIALVLFGGLLYTLGGITYAIRRPDPWPAVFGYHEVFHTLVVRCTSRRLRFTCCRSSQFSVVSSQLTLRAGLRHASHQIVVECACRTEDNPRPEGGSRAAPTAAIGVRLQV
jgi:hemolysin III